MQAYLDASAASINYFVRTGNSPVKVFQFIASGVLGKNPFPSGYTRDARGLLFHFCNAYLFTIFFFVIYPKIKMPPKNSIITGLLYGCFVWLVMNLVVVPMSHTPKLPFNLTQTIPEVVFLMACVGLPSHKWQKIIFAK